MSSGPAAPGIPRLFHFSEDPSIERFVPRAVEVPSERPAGMGWLNGPLVWAVTEQRQATYLFPRDCPRILLWLTPDTTEDDRVAWWGERDTSMIAFVEWRWLQAVRSTEVFRYELPTRSFRSLDGDWTWVSEEAVEPLEVEDCGDLMEALAALRSNFGSCRRCDPSPASGRPPYTPAAFGSGTPKDGRDLLMGPLVKGRRCCD